MAYPGGSESVFDNESALSSEEADTMVGSWRSGALYCIGLLVKPFLSYFLRTWLRLWALLPVYESKAFPFTALPSKNIWSIDRTAMG